MEEILTLLIGILALAIILLSIITLFSTISYLFYRIKHKDYSDQTGWRNFSKPFLAIVLVILSILMTIVGLLIMTTIFKL